MADHTGEKTRVDTNSIKTTTLMSFVLFALFLVIILWGLSNFFIGRYYERARSQEVIRTADALEVQFRQAAHEDFDSYAVQTAGTNGHDLRECGLLFCGSGLVSQK